MVKLAIITGSDIRCFGGGEKYVLELANRLKNFNITIISRIGKTSLRLSTEEISKMTKAKIKFYNAPKVPILGVQFMLFSLNGWKMAIRLKDFDVVYGLDSTSITNAALILFSRIYGFKYIFGAHDPGFLKVNPEKNIFIRRILFKVYRPIYKKIFFSVQNIHVLTNHYKKRLETEGYKGKIYLIPNFLYYNKSSIRIISNDRKFIVLFGGRLAIYQKGIDLLVNIIKKVIDKNKNIEFQIFGSGKDGQELIENLSEGYNKNVKYLGFISGSDLEKEYKNSSLYIMTSRIEAFPSVILEAQAHGLPVVAFGINGPKDAITNFSGSIIEPFDVDAFANAILRYYNLWKDGKLGIKYKKRVIDYIFSKYSDKIIIPKIQKMFID